MAKYILVYDLGTCEDKTAIFDEKGKPLAICSCSYKTYYPKPLYVEQSPAEWWKAVCLSTREILAKTKVLSKDIVGISFSGQMMGAIPVDKEGKLLRKNTLIWSDARSAKQSKSIITKIGGMERFYAITGGWQLPETYSISKIVWMKENEPDIFKKTHKFLQTKDYIISKLTGKFITDYSDASHTGALDIKKRDYSDEIISAAGISRDKLPEIYESIDVVGEVTKEAAKETGLISGVPVVAGGGDLPCSACGAGLVKEEISNINMGSGTWMGIFSQQPLFDSKNKLLNLVHVVPKAYATFLTDGGGISYQWFIDNFCEIESKAAKKSGIDVFDILESKAETVSAGSNNLIFLPYMYGCVGAPYYNPSARGVFIGLNLAHQKKHFARSIMEGLVFNGRIFLEFFENSGVKIKEIRISGGGAKSKLWQQIFADVFNRSINSTAFTQGVGALGAAIVCGVGVGMFKDFSIADDLIKIAYTCEPRSEFHQKYEELYPLFKEIYKVLEPVFSRLASVRSD